MALSAYTDDAFWDATAVGLERFEGAEEILGFFERDAESIAEQFHIITNHIVEFDDDEHAHGTNYVLSEGVTKRAGRSRRPRSTSTPTGASTAAGRSPAA